MYDLFDFYIEPKIIKEINKDYKINNNKINNNKSLTVEFVIPGYDINDLSLYIDKTNNLVLESKDSSIYKGYKSFKKIKSCYTDIDIKIEKAVLKAGILIVQLKVIEPEVIKPELFNIQKG